MWRSLSWRMDEMIYDEADAVPETGLMLLKNL